MVFLQTERKGGGREGGKGKEDESVPFDHNTSKGKGRLGRLRLTADHGIAAY